MVSLVLRRPSLEVALVAAAVLVAACGGSDADTDPGDASAGGTSAAGGSAGGKSGAGGVGSSAGGQGGSGAGQAGEGQGGAGLGGAGSGGEAGDTGTSGQGGASAAGEGGAGGSEAGAGGSDAGGEAGAGGSAQAGSGGAGGSGGSAGSGGKGGSGGASPGDYEGRFSSPSIVRDGNKLHAYFARQKIDKDVKHTPHAVFENNQWTFVNDALPTLHSDAVGGDSGFVWAPGAARIADGQWVLYYTAQKKNTEQKMCIWRAHATTAAGPFVDDFDGPIVCPDGPYWAIDAYLVRDANQNWNLLARIDEPNGVNTLQIRRLNDKGTGFAADSTWHQLLQITKGGWEEPVMENAAIVRLPQPDGSTPRWYVFYSGGSWRNNSYSVGYADCGTSVNGPCTKKTVAKPWMATDPDMKMFGPGTPTFYKDTNGDDLMAVSAWKYSGGTDNAKNNMGQIMFTFKVTVNQSGVPVATFVRVDE